MAELNNYEYAIKLIEAYIEKPLTVKTATETMIRLNKNGVGKLKYLPIVAVTEAKGLSRSYSGITETGMSADSVYLIDEYGHFIVNSDLNIGFQIWGNPNSYKITYTYGFATIPDEIEAVARIIESNILKREEMGGLNGVKSISTLDFNVALFDDKLISSNELSILNKYKGV